MDPNFNSTQPPTPNPQPEPIVPTSQPQPVIISPEGQVSNDVSGSESNMTSTDLSTQETPTISPSLQPDPVPVDSVAGQPPIVPDQQPTPGQALFQPDSQTEHTQTPTSFPPAPKKKRKKLLLVVVGVALFALLSGGVVFGYYLPNTPQNVWKSGLDRSGQAVNKLVGRATEKETLAAYEKSDVTIDLSGKSGTSSYSGSLNVKYDTSKADGSLSVTAKEQGSADKVFTAKFLGELKAGSQFPSVYFQFSGLKSFGLDTYSPALSSYENKWIAIEESYFKSLGITPEQVTDSQNKQISADDTAEAAKAVAGVTGDYVLTSNPKKAVFDQKKYVAKEKVDGIQAYHYVVAINKAHAKDYCSALIEKVLTTQVYKKTTTSDPATIDSAKKSLIKSCQDSVSGIKDSDTFDLWIDASRKLIHKIRVTDQNDKESYMDIGQNYTGGNDVGLFVNVHDGKGKSDGKFTISTNLNTRTTKGSLTITNTGTYPYEFKLSLDAKPYTGDIKVEKPAGAVPIQDVLKALGFDTSYLTSASSSSGSLTANAQDTERNTDIKALHGQIEAYYAQYGKYPTLANMNDSAWLATNMKGLDKEALKDPKGTSYSLASSPAQNVYSYSVKANDGSACNDTTKDCTKYTLTATLSTGSTFTKENLN